MEALKHLLKLTSTSDSEAWLQTQVCQPHAPHQLSSIPRNYGICSLRGAAATGQSLSPPSSLCSSGDDILTHDRKCDLSVACRNKASHSATRPQHSFIISSLPVNHSFSCTWSVFLSVSWIYCSSNWHQAFAPMLVAEERHQSSLKVLLEPHPYSKARQPLDLVFL